MDKIQLRQEGIKKLTTLSQQSKKKQEKEARIAGLLFASRSWQEATTIGLVRSTAIEFDNLPLFIRGFAEKKRLVVPKTAPNRQLVFHEVTDASTYVKSTFGVEEPGHHAPILKEAIDLLLVPGVIFSPQGYRIGFGGGYYDRFLADFPGKTISLVFSEQLRSDWQPESFDLPVDKLITDTYRKEEHHEF